MKNTFLFIIILFLTSCTSGYPGAITPAAGSTNANIIAVDTPRPRPTATPSIVPSATQNPYLDIYVSQTAVEIEKVHLAQEASRLQVEQAQLDMQLTSDGATSTSAAAITQTHRGDMQLTAAATAGVPSTQVAGSSTSAAATRTAEEEEQEHNANIFGIWIGKGFLFILALAFLGGVVYGGILAFRGLHFKMSQMAPDENGRYKLVAESAIPGKEKRLINPNLATRVSISPQDDDLTAEQSLINTQSHRQLEATRAIAQSPAMMRQLTKQKPTGSDAHLPTSDVGISKPEINYLTDGAAIAPAWSLIEGWDGAGDIPYGVSAQGLERVSIQQVPHGGIFGKTGKGKSRYFLRTFIAGAIAAGHRVVILGKQADFQPFADHPNVKMIPVKQFTVDSEAARYANCLRQIVEEMNRRDDYLTANHVSTWDRAGRENTLLVLDELGNSLDMMPREIASEAYRLVQGLVKEGRKVGLNVWLASQRAVGFKSIVEQLGRAVFYLSDAEASRYALGFPGAEMLRDGHFYAKFQSVRKCAAFDPTDDELTSFLSGRAVKSHEPIDWIDGTVIEDGNSNAISNEKVSVDDHIVEIYTRMKADNRVSLSEIQRRVYGDVNTGGAHFRHIQEVISRQNGTTTTENMPGTGILGSSATSSAV
jgi:hypothetical protein